MKEYWLSIYSDTFIWVRNEKICVYNAKNKAFLKDSFSEDLKKIVDGLQEIDNLYTVIITEEDLGSSVVDSWIKRLINADCCDWVANDGVTPKPISLKPVLKITDDMRYYKDCHSKGHNANLLSNLHRLVVYLNGSEYGNDTYARQCIYPFEQQKELDLRELCDFIVSSGTLIYLSEIIFVGCLWKHHEYGKLLEFLNQLSIKVSVYCTEQDYYHYMTEGQTPNLPEISGKDE